LGTWVSHCGTYGCLVGNDFVANRDARPNLEAILAPLTSWAPVGKEYGLTVSEVIFLFASFNWRREYRKQYGLSMPAQVNRRSRSDKAAAIARVYKFIYYTLHKSDIFSSEEARHVDGDWGLTDKVASRVREELCTV